MRLRSLQKMMNPNLMIHIHDYGDADTYKCKSGWIPTKFLDRKIFSMNPDHESFDGVWEYDCLDVWIEAEEN